MRDEKKLGAANPIMNRESAMMNVERLINSWSRNFSRKIENRSEKSNQSDKQEKQEIKNLIPKLCNTKYKACKLRNPSVISGRLQSCDVDWIYDSTDVTRRWLVSALSLSALFFSALSLNIWAESKHKTRNGKSTTMTNGGKKNITTQLGNETKSIFGGKRFSLLANHETQSLPIETSILHLI